MYTRPSLEESCDDGNVDSGDGCSAECTIECGYICFGQGSESCRTQCGDGIVAGNEVCDDYNLLDLDGCDANCSAVETGWTCSNSLCNTSLCWEVYTYTHE